MCGPAPIIRKATASWSAGIRVPSGNASVRAARCRWRRPVGSLVNLSSTTTPNVCTARSATSPRRINWLGARSKSLRSGIASWKPLARRARPNAPRCWRRSKLAATDRPRLTNLTTALDRAIWICPVKQRRALLKSNLPRDNWMRRRNKNVSAFGGGKTSPKRLLGDLYFRASLCLKKLGAWGPEPSSQYCLDVNWKSPFHAEPRHFHWRSRRGGQTQALGDAIQYGSRALYKAQRNTVRAVCSQRSDVSHSNCGWPGQNAVRWMVRFHLDSGDANQRGSRCAPRIEPVPRGQSLEPEHFPGPRGDQLGCHHEQHCCEVRQWALSPGLRTGLPVGEPSVRHPLQRGPW